jgi:hypothetical protein
MSHTIYTKEGREEYKDQCQKKYYAFLCQCERVRERVSLRLYFRGE